MRRIPAFPVLLLVLLVASLAELAMADRVMTASSAKAAITHGDWQRLPDGSLQLNACGATKDAKTGKAVPLEHPCVTCLAATWAKAEAACASAWRKANGL